MSQYDSWRHAGGTARTSQSSKGKKSLEQWLPTGFTLLTNLTLCCRSKPSSNQQPCQNRILDKLYTHERSLADNRADTHRHTPPTFQEPSVSSLPSLLFSFCDMTPCLGLPDKLSFYQSAVMPSRQTLSAQRLAGLRLPIASPLLPFFCSLVLPTLCQQKASIPASLLSYCTVSVCLFQPIASYLSSGYVHRWENFSWWSLCQKVFFGLSLDKWAHGACVIR